MPRTLAIGYRPGRQLQSETAYEKVGWVYRCVRAILGNAAQVPWYAVKRSKKRSVPLPDVHPAAQLLAKPNDEDDFSAIIESTILHMHLRGEGFWELSTGAQLGQSSLPAYIYSHPAQWLEEVHADPRTHKYTNFSLRVDGKRFDIPGENGVLFKFYNPQDPLRGLSPMSAAFQAADTDHSAQVFNAKYFDNAGVINLQYGFDKDGPIQEWTKELEARVTANLRNMHAGMDNWHRDIVTGPGEFIKLISSGAMKDMDFQALRKFNRGEIQAVFGVPPILCGDVENANRANSSEQRAMFWEDTLIPILSDVASLANRKVFHRFGPDIFIEPDFSQVPALRKDLQKIADAAVPLVTSNVMTINEVRVEYLDLPPVEWGDERYDAAHNGAPETATDENGAATLTTETAVALLREYKNATISRIREGAVTSALAFPPSREAQRAARKFKVARKAAWDLARAISIELSVAWDKRAPADAAADLFDRYEAKLKEPKLLAA